MERDYPSDVHVVRSGDKEIILTNLRHYHGLQQALGSMETAERSLAEGRSEEYVILDLNAASARVADLLGESTDDDLLERIFSRFCIGK